MSNNPRCLYENSFEAFLRDTELSIFGSLCDNYHGEARTTTLEAWKAEIFIMRETLFQLDNKDGRIIFEYDIPRLGKRIDVVLLYNGIIFASSLRLVKRGYWKQTWIRFWIMRWILITFINVVKKK